MLEPQEKQLLQTIVEGVNQILSMETAEPAEAGEVEKIDPATAMTLANTAQGMMQKPEVDKGKGQMAGKVLDTVRDIGVASAGNMKPPAGSPPPSDEAQKMVDNQRAEDDDVRKANEGPTADDKAELRTEDGTDITEENYSEVGKAFMNLFAKKSVRKSAGSQSDNIAIVLKGISDRIGQMETAQANLLDAIGLTESVEKSLMAGQNNTVQKSAPVSSPDANAFMQSFVEMVMKAQGTQASDPFARPETGLENVRKDLRNSMDYIFQDNLRQSQ